MKLQNCERLKPLKSAQEAGSAGSAGAWLVRLDKILVSAKMSGIMADGLQLGRPQIAPGFYEPADTEMPPRVPGPRLAQVVLACLDPSCRAKYFTSNRYQSVQNDGADQPPQSTGQASKTPRASLVSLSQFTG